MLRSFLHTFNKLGIKPVQSAGTRLLSPLSPSPFGSALLQRPVSSYSAGSQVKISSLFVSPTDSPLERADWIDDFRQLLIKCRVTTLNLIEEGRLATKDAGFYCEALAIALEGSGVETLLLEQGVKAGPLKRNTGLNIFYRESKRQALWKAGALAGAESADFVTALNSVKNALPDTLGGDPVGKEARQLSDFPSDNWREHWPKKKSAWPDSDFYSLRGEEDPVSKPPSFIPLYRSLKTPLPLEAAPEKEEEQKREARALSPYFGP